MNAYDAVRKLDERLNELTGIDPDK